MSDDKIQPEVEIQEIEEPVVQTKNSSGEIAKLHRECAKYRIALKNSNDEKTDFQKQLGDTKSELETALKQNKEQLILHKLQNSGCLKPSLVIKEIPNDCNDFDEFLSTYQQENPFLFERPKNKHGYAFSGGRAVNYTPSQQMNSYIRSALGR